MAIKFSKITRSMQRNLKLGEKLDEHGITFERLMNGDGRYKINIMVDGQRIHRVVGKESEGVTRLQAFVPIRIHSDHSFSAGRC